MIIYIYVMYIYIHTTSNSRFICPPSLEHHNPRLENLVNKEMQAECLPIFETSDVSIY